MRRLFGFRSKSTNTGSNPEEVSASQLEAETASKVIPASQDSLSFPSQIAVGIDLGTTYSVIAHLDSMGRPWTIANAEGDLTTPSVVLFDRESVVVGKEAVNAMALEPKHVAQFVKGEMGNPFYSRPINGERLPPEVIQSFILRKLKEDAEKKLGVVRKAVVTVPAFFNEPRRKATQDAGQLAGLEVIDIINEPTAAAIAYGVQRGFLTAKGEAKQAEMILVYDLGGGTFDVTLMQIEGNAYRTIATAGDVYLGGIDWDRRIVDHVAQHFKDRYHGIDPREHPAGADGLLRKAEEAKRSLSARETAKIIYTHAGYNIALSLSRQEFESLTADLLDRTRFTTTNLLREAGMNVMDVTRVILVGGSTRMPMVGAMLERELGIKPDRSLSVDEAVAHGAAIYAGLLLANKSIGTDITVCNVNSHSLGVLGIEPATGRKRNTVLIPKNTRLPATSTRRFETRRDNQPNVAVDVIEGGDASGNGATSIGKCIVRNLPAELPAGTPVEVTFKYLADGRLRVQAWLPGLDRAADLVIDRSSGLTEERVAFWKKRLEDGLGPLKLDA